jgi:hypothetical protein
MRNSGQFTPRRKENNMAGPLPSDKIKGFNGVPVIESDTVPENKVLFLQGDGIYEIGPEGIRILIECLNPFPPDDPDSWENVRNYMP